MAARVPHAALLARYSSVDPDTGIYQPPQNRAVVYGSLTHVCTALLYHSQLPGAAFAILGN